MAEKRKAVSFSTKLTTKDAGENDERRIVFVASSGGLDRDGDMVDIDSLRLPLKKGGHVMVKDLEGSDDELDIPLMLNHSFSVADVIGSVRKAYVENGELVFEAGISSRDIAQDVLTLIEEGHLGNAFSITMSDYAYEDNTIKGAEVLEVSLVWRGSNKDARLLAVKSILGGQSMAETKEKALTADEAEKLREAIFSAVEQAVSGVSETNAEDETEEVETESKEAETEVVESETTETEEEKPEAETEEKEEVEGEATAPETETEAEGEAEAETEEEEKEDKEKEEDKEEDMETKAKQALNVTSDYLKSKQALADFREVVTKNHRASSDQVMQAWNDHLSSKGVTGDAILPAQIEEIFFKTWGDEPTILGTFRFLGRRSAAIYAANLGEDGTAHGHKKGEDKVDQDIELVRRDIKALCIYKKLPLDLQDLFDDETGELLRFRVEELADRVAHAIAVGAIVGVDEYLQDGRGLNPMTADLEAEEGFGTKVATVVEAGEDDDEYAKAVKTLAAVKDTGRGKVLIVKEGWIGQLKLTKTATGYLFPATANVAEVLGATIYELPEIEDSGFDMIAYARDSYVLAGQATADVRTDFDLTKNQDVMLVERYVAGSASGWRTVAGYKASAES